MSDVQPITFIPDILNDSNFAGGGRPDADRPAARAPTPPAPAAQPAPAAPAPRPKPKVKEVAPPETDNESLEIAKDKKPTKRKLEISTTPVRRNPKAKPRSEDTAAEDRRARERLAMQNRLASAFDRTLGDIKSGTGQAAKIEGSRGPGGGGPSYAGYAAWVLTVFDNAWVAPEDTSSTDATAEVSVTIASDGTVIAKRIIKHSGDAAVDASVQRALDRVITIGRPFPESMKDKRAHLHYPFQYENQARFSMKRIFLTLISFSSVGRKRGPGR